MNIIDQAHGDNWQLYHGDCVEVLAGLPDDSIDLSIFSPPFGSLYVYSDDYRDMGNCTSDEEFMDGFRFLVKELYRVTVPGRCAAIHCSNIPYQKWKDGRIGIKDFRGDLIRAFVDPALDGWILHAETTIWKCPVTEMQRTKANGLLHMQLKKDSSKSRTGMADYLLVFRKAGDNPKPVTHTAEDFPVTQWQEWASPVWMDIKQTNTLNVRQAKGDRDEKHICPLQLDFIERCLILWSNPGDTILDPFNGIGSTGYMAVKNGRKYIGIELKESYYQTAIKYLTEAETNGDQGDLFRGCGAA